MSVVSIVSMTGLGIEMSRNVNECEALYGNYFVLVVLEAVFSTLIGRDPTMFCSHWLDLDHSVATPAVRCHKEPAKSNKCKWLGAFRPIGPSKRVP